jgi:hypothetical protein
MCTRLVWLRIGTALVNSVLNFGFHTGILSSGLTTGGLSNSAQLHS